MPVTRANVRGAHAETSVKQGICVADTIMNKRNRS
jgi:hypothetical protein